MSRKTYTMEKVCGNARSGMWRGNMKSLKEAITKARSESRKSTGCVVTVFEEPESDDDGIKKVIAYRKGAPLPGVRKRNRR